MRRPLTVFCGVLGAALGLAPACGGASPEQASTGSSSQGSASTQDASASVGGSSSTSAGGGTSVGQASSSGEVVGDPEESCFEEQWRWQGDVPSSRAMALAHGEATALLDTDVNGQVRLFAFDATGALAIEPVVVGNGVRGDVAAGPDGEWWLVTGSAEGDHFSRRSSEGAGLSDHLLVLGGAVTRLWRIAVAPGGDAVLGGSLDDRSSGQAHLLAVDRDGGVLWQHAAEGDRIDALAVDGDGTIFATAISTLTEGADVNVVRLDPEGVLGWSVLVGSHGGFGDERVSPFGLGLDGEGGVVTIGAEPGDSTPVALTERYDADGVARWQTEAELEEGEVIPEAGAVSRVGALGYVAVVNGWGPTLVLLDLDGGVLCQRRLGTELSIVAVVGTSEDTVVVAGQDGEGAQGRTWLAQFRASGAD